MIQISHKLLEVSFDLKIEDKSIFKEIYKFFSAFDINNANTVDIKNLLTVSKEKDFYTLTYLDSIVHLKEKKKVIGQIIYYILEAFLKQLENKLILHGAAVMSDNGVTCFIGKSREGKSTITVSLLEKSTCKYITDDIIVITEQGEIIPFPKPIYLRDIELWNSLKNVSYKSSFVYENMERFWYIPKNIVTIKKYKINRIVYLNRIQADVFKYDKKIGKDSFKILMFNLHNKSPNMPMFLPQIKKIANDTEIGELFFKDIFIQFEDFKALL